MQEQSIIPLPLIIQVLQSKLRDDHQDSDNEPVVLAVVENPNVIQKEEFPLLFVTRAGNVPFTYTIGEEVICFRSLNGNLVCKLPLHYFVGEPN